MFTNLCRSEKKVVGLLNTCQEGRGVSSDHPGCQEVSISRRSLSLSLPLGVFSSREFISLHASRSRWTKVSGSRVFYYMKKTFLSGLVCVPVFGSIVLS